MQFDPAQIGTLVIKIGTNLLRGKLAFEGKVIEAVVRELCELKRDHDLNILIVTSGAVGCGMTAIGMEQRPNTLPGKQAVAAIGQATLMHYYETLLRHYGDLHAAQILLTPGDLDDRERYLNVRNTLNTLFDMKKVVPVVNENDTTAVEQLRFGDNDTLAARVASKINAGLLIILSDVDGLYDKNPAAHADARLLPVVDAITPEISAGAAGPGTATGTGGMHTKLTAASMATAAGVPVVIANGHRLNIIKDVLQGAAPCTVFTVTKEALSHRKRWIAFGRQAVGRLHVDEGARRALLESGKSLLPAGVVDVTGEFEVGAAVEIVDQNGVALARALVNYSSDDIRAVMGRKTSDISNILGRKDFDEIVHRDNLVVL
jgi:glutamate 5-kinase